MGGLRGRVSGWAEGEGKWVGEGKLEGEGKWVG